MEATLAKLNSRIDDFREDNDRDVGKKIEGTGFLQVPYFVWLLIVAAVGFVGIIILGVLWTALKAYGMSNPPVALGLQAVELGGKATAKLASQLVKGGESFKDRIEKTITDSKVKEQVLGLFSSAHKEAQSPENQAVIKELIK